MTPDLLIQQSCQAAAEALGVGITAPFVLVDADGVEYDFIALFKQVGSEKGTLVCQADDWLHKNQVAVRNGYYCSGLHPDSYCKFDRTLWLETFRDWGWHGPKWERPPWKGGGPRQRGQRKSRK